MLDFLTLQTTSAHPALISIIYTVLLSFALSSLIAIVYEKTFRGLSYSRNYVQAIILSSIVAATVMQAIGDSLARGLGMIGALAIVRFRTSFKDPRDIIFMFAALAAGVACGVNGYSVAVVGTLGFCLAGFILYWSPFGQTSYFDGMLRFNIENDAENKSLLEDVLRAYCKTFALITLRDMAQDRRLDYAYHIKLKKGKRKDDFIEALREIKTIKGIHLLLQETTVEL
ncbi:hypothetical protein DENIS_0135 [Desulfonema ishimotonii]|uniref:DUF4956 domain-containing protein n=1 Tax=Desulfonema ishimotonii TaxID=45657 RepID=A0A401FQC9_9BACT|nr:DUF4956 domain-containing protein [Desulfonema ishimotonii]GBC59199.1 hypothetical protein DENIS_0135 [Desulfonema ishimotonii]